MSWKWAAQLKNITLNAAKQDELSIFASVFGAGFLSEIYASWFYFTMTAKLSTVKMYRKLSNFN